MQYDPSRRTFVAGITAALASFPATANTARLCLADPTISNPTAPLTIDTHAHFFNGRICRSSRFCRRRPSGPDSELYPLVNEMGAVLQTLAWHLAPSAGRNACHRALCGAAQGLHQRGPDAQSGGAIVPGGLRGRAARTAGGGRWCISRLPVRPSGPKAGKAGLGAAMADLPATYDEFEERRSDGDDYQQ